MDYCQLPSGVLSILYLSPFSLFCNIRYSSLAPFAKLSAAHLRKLLPSSVHFFLEKTNQCLVARLEKMAEPLLGA